MALYSLLLAAVFVVGAPYWIVRMLTSGRYRAGLPERFGVVPPEFRAAVEGRKVVWVHAVSVGEVLAATPLIAELERSLSPDWLIVLSTTTATGQRLARERLGQTPARVFYYPVDLAFAVRAWLRVLRPRLFALMESELWPRMLLECRRAGVPVAVVNARVSDRSFARSNKVRALWSRLLRLPTLFLAQSEEDRRRLIALGADPASVTATGNLKYDVRAAPHGSMAERIREIAAGRPVLVAGSTHGARKGERFSEDQLVLRAWEGLSSSMADEEVPLLVLAPRHPQRFAEVEALVSGYSYLKATGLTGPIANASPDIVLLDTIGDLASVYSIATVAFVGGSLVGRGGHNPLEPAQFGVPVVVGPSMENFRDILTAMRGAHAIRVVEDIDSLGSEFTNLLANPEEARALGERAKSVFAQQQGATARTVASLLDLLPNREQQS